MEFYTFILLYLLVFKMNSSSVVNLIAWCLKWDISRTTLLILINFCILVLNLIVDRLNVLLVCWGPCMSSNVFIFLYLMILAYSTVCPVIQFNIFSFSGCPSKFSLVSCIFSYIWYVISLFTLLVYIYIYILHLRVCVYLHL